MADYVGDPPAGTPTVEVVPSRPLPPQLADTGLDFNPAATVLSGLLMVAAGAALVKGWRRA